MRKSALIIFLFLILFKPIYIIYEQRENLFNFNYESRYEGLEFDYYNSQYVKKNNPKIITDEGFEEFAGGAFLKGLNPILITHDHPPLGRYIISLSILLFNNSKIIIIPLLALGLAGVFLISKSIIKDNLLSLIPLVVFVNEPLFFEKLTYVPIPEAVLFPFIIWCLYFYIKYISKKRLIHTIAGSILLGCVISIRVFTVGLSILAGVFLYYLLKRKIDKNFIQFLLTLPLAGIVLGISYTRTIIDTGNPFVVFGIQKYILAYHSSKFILPFTFWDLILFNRWHTWWGDMAITSDDIWMITWPISITIVIFTSIYRFRKKDKFITGELIISLFLLIYCGMLSLSYTSTRYFMPIIPLLYILATYGIFRLMNIKKLK